MRYLQIITRMEEARELWRAQIPAETVFDLWEVREALHRHYQRPLRFLFCDAPDQPRVFLPLSWVEEKGACCFFPGETWSNKTWLEQNHADFGGLSREELEAKLGTAVHLRYLRESPTLDPVSSVDEIGYLFHPPCYEYKIENWWMSFSRKKRRQIRRELCELEEHGATVRRGNEDDFDLMVAMSLRRFGASSYFVDSRFRQGFREVFAILARQGRLRVTVVDMNSVPVAVDFGSVYQGRYTLLAGGTDAQFPGVAKLINLYHLQWACHERLQEVDFLCGESSWKPLFHLTSRPLYLVASSHSG